MLEEISGRPRRMKKRGGEIKVKMNRKMNK